MLGFILSLIGVCALVIVAAFVGLVIGAILTFRAIEFSAGEVLEWEERVEFLKSLQKITGGVDSNK